MAETQTLMTLEQAKGNIDLFCAAHGHAIAEKLLGHILGTDTSAEKKKKAASEAENLITRSLGVLQGQGIYAVFLLLTSRKGKEDQKTSPETILSGCLSDCIIHMNKTYRSATKGILDDLREGPILSDIPTLLLVKRTMERALTYARYHAKAQGGPGDGN